MALKLTPDCFQVVPDNYEAQCNAAMRNELRGAFEQGWFLHDVQGSRALVLDAGKEPHVTREKLLAAAADVLPHHVGVI